MLAIGLFLSEAPPTPTITYSEFPFHLEYTINGETVVIDDVLVCEYDGIAINEASGKYRVWKSYIKSTGEDSVLITSDGNLEWRMHLGNEELYMGDYSSYNYYYDINDIEAYNELIEKDLKPSIYPQKVSPDVVVGDTDMYEDFIIKYGVEITEWEIAPPIENEFID